MSHQSDIEAFIARNGVTKCPPAEGKARSLRAMRRDAERAASGDDPEPEAAESKPERDDSARAEYDSERHLRRMEHWAACRAAGVPRDVAWEEVDEIQ